MKILTSLYAKLLYMMLFFLILSVTVTSMLNIIVVIDLDRKALTEILAHNKENYYLIIKALEYSHSFKYTNIIFVPIGIIILYQ